MLLKLIFESAKRLTTQKNQEVPRATFSIGIGALFVILALSVHLQSHALSGVLAGCILSLANAFIGYLFIEKSFEYKDSLFVAFSLGGLVLRFALMIGSIAVMLTMTNVHVGGFIGGLFVSYFLFQAAEVIHVNSRTNRLKIGRVQPSR